ncbi:MAG: hypothetical protein QNL61_07365 [Crocinitomicaceae bacterium]
MILKKILFIMLLVFSSPSLILATDDQGGETNKVDGQGRKQGKWVYLGKDRPEFGFPLNGKIEEGPYINDRKEGVWIKYHNDGVTPKLKGEYHNNRPSGKYTKLYPDGTIREVGTFDRNKYADSLKRYHENGVLEYEADYNETGKEQGVVKYYYPNGQEEFIFESQNGIPTGKASRYYENGDVKEIIYYAADGSIERSEQREIKNPAVNVVDPGVSKEAAPRVTNPRTKGTRFQTNGYNKVYNDNDEIWQDGDFRNGRLWDGKVYEYDSDGILLKVKVFKKGVYHSDGQL